MASQNGDSFTVPHLRSHWARALYQRIQHQKQHENDPHEMWYTIDEKELPENLSRLFFKCHQDEETEEFLRNCYDKADWVFTQLYHSIGKSLLTWFMNPTSVNGLLARGSMFVTSCRQFSDLLQITDDKKLGYLLDLAAGDGQVTKSMAPFFENVHATEMSTVMQWRLRQMNYTVIGIDDWITNGVEYDVISCLNLVDRCDKPLTLLKHIKSRLKPKVGRLILAAVFPIKQYIEFSKNHQPDEIINVTAARFEWQVTQFVHDVLTPAGFELLRWSKLPYLCEGDMCQSFYFLIDAVFILKIAE